MYLGYDYVPQESIIICTIAKRAGTNEEKLKILHFNSVSGSFRAICAQTQEKTRQK